MIFRELNGRACRTYLIGSDRTREVVLVDPVLDQVQKYLDLIGAEGLKLRWVIDTHTHADHLSGAHLIQEKTQVHYLMHLNSEVACVSKRLRERDALGLGEITMSFLHAPGHTRDSVVVMLPDRILSGDFLFIGEGAAGRLDLPGGSPDAHYASLRKLDKLPDATLLFPAHDYRGEQYSTLSRERQTNPLLRPRSREEYLKYWEDLQLGPAEWMKKVLEANVAGATDPNAAPIPSDAASGACSPCASAGASAPVPAVDPRELRSRIEKGEKLFVLDVREPQEYVGELGHIKGATLIPLGQLDARLKEVPKDRPVVAVCKTGGRSRRAASTLISAGFAGTASMEGGMQAWNDEECPVER